MRRVVGKPCFVKARSSRGLFHGDKAGACENAASSRRAGVQPTPQHRRSFGVDWNRSAVQWAIQNAAGSKCGRFSLRLESKWHCRGVIRRPPPDAPIGKGARCGSRRSRREGSGQRRLGGFSVIMCGGGCLTCTPLATLCMCIVSSQQLDLGGCRMYATGRLEIFNSSRQPLRTGQAEP